MDPLDSMHGFSWDPHGLALIAHGCQWISLSFPWDSTVPQKVLELATRLVDVAQSNSEWRRKMSSDRLNQAGKPISTAGMPANSKIYFYKPPARAQVEARGSVSMRLAFSYSALLYVMISRHNI